VTKGTACKQEHIFKTVLRKKKYLAVKVFRLVKMCNGQVPICIPPVMKQGLHYFTTQYNTTAIRKS
jgi:hypothetical protein